MSNLLPKFVEKKNTREYRLRFFTLVFVFLSCISFIGSILLLPSYFLSKTKESVVKNTLDDSRLKQGLSADESVRGIINDINKKIDVFVFYADEPISRIIKENILDLAKDNFLISISYGTIKNKKVDEEKISVRGIAKNRLALQKFVESLNNTGVFVPIETPVSSFTEKTSINFDISLVLVNKK